MLHDRLKYNIWGSAGTNRCKSSECCVLIGKAGLGSILVSLLTPPLFDLLGVSFLFRSANMVLLGTGLLFGRITLSPGLPADIIRTLEM